MQESYEFWGFSLQLVVSKWSLLSPVPWAYSIMLHPLWLMPALWKSVMIFTHVQSQFLEAGYAPKSITNARWCHKYNYRTKLHKYLGNEIQQKWASKLLYDETVCKNMHHFLAIFHWRMQGSRSRWSFHLTQHIFIECLLCARHHSVKHQEHKRDKQHKDSGSLASIREGLHKNIRKGTTGNFRNT